MGVNSFDQLLEHVGHRIECVTYGTPPANVSLECEDCGVVLMDFDAPLVVTKDDVKDDMPNRTPPRARVGYRTREQVFEEVLQKYVPEAAIGGWRHRWAQAKADEQEQREYDDAWTRSLVGITRFGQGGG